MLLVNQVLLLLFFNKQKFWVKVTENYWKLSIRKNLLKTKTKNKILTKVSLPLFRFLIKQRSEVEKNPNLYTFDGCTVVHKSLLLCIFMCVLDMPSTLRNLLFFPAFYVLFLAVFWSYSEISVSIEKEKMTQNVISFALEFKICVLNVNLS